MPWVRIDENFSTNEKVLKAGKDGRELYVSSLCHCNRNLTDGFVDADLVRQLGAMFEVYEVDSVIAKLVKLNLWEVVNGGYQVHDYLKYNPSKADVLKQRAANAKRQADWQSEHRDSNGRYQQDTNDIDNTVTNDASNGISNVRLPSPSPSPSPSPIPVSESVSEPTIATDVAVAGGKIMSSALSKEPNVRKRSAHDEIRLSLEIYFSEQTGIPRPRIENDKQRKGAGTLWWEPLRNIAELAEWDIGKACALVDKALDHAKGRFDVSSPKSISSTALSIATGNAVGSVRESLPKKRTIRVIDNDTHEARDVEART